MKNGWRTSLQVHIWIITKINISTDNMGLFGGLYKKKEPVLDPVDLSILQVDVHSHFIPGIDDGAKTIEDSIELISAMKDFGYRKVITTPHIMSDYYRNTPEIILGGLEKVREALKQNNIDIEVDAAAEYNVDADFPEKIENKELLTFGDNYVLFELPFMEEPVGLKDVIWQMQAAGYKPVLAHVERYQFWHQQWSKFEDMINRGVLLQINIGSLTGSYGPEVREVAEKLIDNDMISLLGSDCHHMGHVEMIDSARTKEYIHKIVNSPKLLNNKL